ncbi:hypothetical protein [Hyphomicrobium sp.]|uniref:hypothetical protein n=1 Tax=Hyphomicrobium sp. TaxID=82 RepID=UPI001DA092E9|nr:hypothetical protein [Hyphomicrobium sp.]MBY0559835.1 hypothetical protein [Hyphomicrobium sp.]
MAVSGLFKKLAVGGGKATGNLVKTGVAMQAYQSVQDKVFDAVGADKESKAASFLGGAVPEWLLTAASGASKLSRMRSALVWGGLNVLYDQLMGSSDAQAEEARQNTDQSFMPQTQRVVDAHQRFATLMQHAEDERAMAASTRPTIDMNGHYNLTEHGERIVALLNKSSSLRTEAEKQHQTALADAWESKNLTGMSASEISVAKMAWQRRHRQQMEAQNARTAAARHVANVERIKDAIVGAKNPRQQTLSGAYKKSAALNKATAAKRMNAQLMKKGKKAKAQDSGRTTGFAGMPNGADRKMMWTDKNGKVYHRQMTLPNFESRARDKMRSERKGG